MSSAGVSPTSDEYESIQENVYETIPVCKCLLYYVMRRTLQLVYIA
jgi:hypothetical protein